jgi:hypothetical protein
VIGGFKAINLAFGFADVALDISFGIGLGDVDRFAAGVKLPVVLAVACC